MKNSSDMVGAAERLLEAEFEILLETKTFDVSRRRATFVGFTPIYKGEKNESIFSFAKSLLVVTRIFKCPDREDLELSETHSIVGRFESRKS